jgi:hypothetical protein
MMKFARSTSKPAGRILQMVAGLVLVAVGIALQSVVGAVLIVLGVVFAAVRSLNVCLVAPMLRVRDLP